MADNTLEPYFKDGSRIRIANLQELTNKRDLYVIFLTPRSGSTWLTDLLRLTGTLGCPQEWLNPGFLGGSEMALGCIPPRVSGIYEVNDYLDDVLKQQHGAVAGIEL